MQAKAILLAARDAAMSDRSLSRTTPRVVSAPLNYPPLFPFTSMDWLLEQNAREAQDSFAAIRRWRISVDPGDRCIREYHLNGTLEQVRARVALFFPNSRLTVIAPQLSGYFESIDRRIHLASTRSRDHVTD